MKVILIPVSPVMTMMLTKIWKNRVWIGMKWLKRRIRKNVPNGIARKRLPENGPNRIVVVRLSREDGNESHFLKIIFFKKVINKNYLE